MAQTRTLGATPACDGTRSRSHRVLATVRLGGTPNDVAVNPRAGKVYVPMFGGSPVGSRPRVLVISGRTDRQHLACQTWHRRGGRAQQPHLQGDLHRASARTRRRSR